MIKLPNLNKSFDYENDFYLSCNSSRVGKILCQYELYKRAINLPGSLVECGVFKGASLMRFAAFRELLMSWHSQKIIAFDTFGKFPKTNFKEDLKYRKRFISEAGENSVSKNQLIGLLKKQGYRNIELIKGNVIKTIPSYIKNNPHLKISLLNIDTDVYEPAVSILEYLYPKVVNGGIVILDNYAVFPGETSAVDEFFEGKKNIKIEKGIFSNSMSYIIKNSES